MNRIEGDGEIGAGAAAPDGGARPPGYDELAGGLALAPALPASGLVLTGEDRARFLHGQATCEVKALGAGRGAYGFLLSPKGKVLADAVISAAQDRLRVELPPGVAAETAERLRRYVVADRVEIESLDATEGLLVAGPRAAAALGALLAGEAPPAGWDHVERSDAEAPLGVRGELRLGVPAWRLSGGSRALDTAAAALARAGAAEAGVDAVEAIRVERGIPRAGIDFDQRHFPQETGLEHWAVSYTKGCYLGQEVVARIHYRGKVNHRLRGLRAPAGAAPGIGPLRDAEGAEAGALTTSIWSPAVGRSIGLAILHRRWAEPGTRLYAADGARMEVVALPFVEPSIELAEEPREDDA